MKNKYLAVTLKNTELCNMLDVLLDANATDVSPH